MSEVTSTHEPDAGRTAGLGSLEIHRASAGSGKTYLLAEKYIIRLMRIATAMQADAYDSMPHRHVLAVTFTNKATNEMKQRIISELYKLKSHAPSDHREKLQNLFPTLDVDRTAGQILDALLQDFQSFQISTIDSFFQRIVRSFARELGLGGEYAVELDNDDMIEQAVDDLYTQVDEGNDELERWMMTFTINQIKEEQGWNIRPQMLRLGKQIFSEQYQQHKQSLEDFLSREHALEDAHKRLDEANDAFLTRLKELADKALEVMQQHGVTDDDFSQKRRRIALLYELQHREIDMGEAGKYGTLNRSYFKEMIDDPAKMAPKNSRRLSEMLNMYNNGFGDAIRQIGHIIDTELTDYISNRLCLKHLDMLAILSHLQQAVGQINHQNNSMLMADTNSLLHKLIDRQENPFVYEKAGISLWHYMIDEFQDTSRLQWDNFLPLVQEAASRGNGSLVVGDVKQSIYRWRNSDWSLMLELSQTPHVASDLHDQQTTNYRSLPDIVRFNNSFFRREVEHIAAHFRDENSKVRPQYAALINSLSDLFAQAYHHLEQKCHKQRDKHGDGYVHIEFVETDGGYKDTLRSLALERSLQILQQMRDRSIALNRVAFIVRYNAEARLLTGYMSEHGVQTVSTEGLLIGNAAPVRFMLSVMRLILSPDDRIQALMMCHEYVRHQLNDSSGTLPEDAGRAVMRAAQFTHDISHAADVPDWTGLYDDAVQTQLAQIAHAPLYEMAEQLVELFQLGRWNNQGAYVQSMLDSVYRYANNHRPDLRAFLQWWDDHGCRQTIPMPDMPDVPQVITIHKSKGLEYDYVIIPFCDWNLDGQSKILWIPRKNEQNPLPLAPIETCREMLVSHYADDYLKEQMQTRMDELNTAYVAFTRPRRELYCIAPKPKSDSGCKTVADLLYDFVRQDAGITCDENGQYHLGVQDQAAVQATDGHVRQPLMMPAFSSIPIGQRQRIRLRASEFILRQQPIETSLLNLGIMMHDLLGRIICKDDQTTALDDMKRDGIVSPSDEPILLDAMRRFWDIEGISRWFDGSWEVHNERTIIDGQGRQHRPDRLMIRGRQAVIVEYKYGRRQAAHARQVGLYMHLIRQMGYETEGWLCYVNEQPHLQQVMPE
ncbi:MAG: UvrD-helicase domain-containing protein [Paludibacteraceae bacterium]|nr:UvrD-helicase domain-containing protein [Paludibacteraceae bacterium]